MILSPDRDGREKGFPLPFFVSTFLVYFLAFLALAWVWATLNERYHFLVSSLWDFSRRFLPAVESGRFPYRDFSFEYPPLFLINFHLEKFLGSVTGVAGLPEVHFFVTIPLFFALYLFLVPQKRRWWALPLLFFLIVPANSSYDFVPALLVVIFLNLLSSGLIRWSLLPLVLAVGLKLYPLIYLPLLWLKDRSRGERRTDILIFLLGVALPYLWAVGNGGLTGLVNSVSFHLQRGIQLESFLALPFYLSHWRSVLAGSYAVVSGEIFYPFWQFSALVVISALVFFFSYLLVVRRKFKIYRRAREQLTDGDFFELAAMLTLLLISLSKVFSPQFLVWYALLTPFLKEASFRRLYVPTILIEVLTIVELSHFPLPPQPEVTTPFVSSLLLRGGLIIYSLAVYGRSIFSYPKEGVGLNV